MSKAVRPAGCNQSSRKQCAAEYRNFTVAEALEQHSVEQAQCHPEGRVQIQDKRRVERTHIQRPKLVFEDETERSQHRDDKHLAGTSDSEFAF